MRIKLGTYSLKIKSYSARELGLDAATPNYTFTIHQKVFHLWYIPLFPVEKHWKIKDAHGKEVLETTPQMRSAIDLKVLKKRSPVWSYSGSIVLALPVLAVFVFFFYGAVDEAFEDVGRSIGKNQRVALKQELAASPEIGDVYTFKTINVEKVTDMNGDVVRYEPSYFSSPHEIEYSINYISKDSVGFEYFDTDKYSDYTYGLKKVFKLSKSEIHSAAQNYQDLKILKYPNLPTDKSKNIVGIFDIKRSEETVGMY